MGVDIGKLVSHRFTNVVCTPRSTVFLMVAHRLVPYGWPFSMCLSSLVGFLIHMVFVNSRQSASCVDYCYSFLPVGSNGFLKEFSLTYFLVFCTQLRPLNY